MKDKIKSNYSRWLFVLPALIIVGALLIYPIFSSTYFSLTTKHLTKPSYKFVWFKNYISILSDVGFYKAFAISILWTICSLLGQIVIGFIPNLLVKMGLASGLPQFLSDGSLVFGTLIFINIWFGAPMIMVNVLSALQTIPTDQYEAAQIDGASKLQQFRHITLPHIKVVVGLLVVLRTIWVFNNFDLIYLITGGGPANATTTVPIYAYNMGWGTKLLGKSSAVTMLLLIFLLIVCTLYFKVIDRWEKEDR